jgi:hypothetical protein
MLKRPAQWLGLLTDLTLACALVVAASLAALGAALLTGVMWLAGVAFKLIEPPGEAGLRALPVRRNPRGWTVDRSSREP